MTPDEMTLEERNLRLAWDMYRARVRADGGACTLWLENAEALCYPQYKYQFDSIPEKLWAWVRAYAKAAYDAHPFADPGVRQHWRDINEGVPPFGLHVVPDKE